MADKPAFGVFPQMKPKRSQQDREAAKNVPVDLARGFVSGTLGAPGDIEALARLPYELITGNESPTILPTSADIEKRLPFKSDTPVSRAATGLGQLGGGAYTGPLSGVRAVTSIPKAVVKAGKDFVMAAGRSVSPLDVWHGSPHKFAPTPKNPLGEFDASKIGTGEGAQAYGHGHYLAEAPDVGQSYRITTTGKLYELENIPATKKWQKDILDDVSTFMSRENVIDPVAAIDNYAKQLESLASSFPESASRLLAKRDWLLSQKNVAQAKRAGHLYKVDLPDEKIARMLDWDKPLSEQPEVIKALKGTDYEVGMSQKQAEKIADQRLREEAEEWAEMTGGDPVDYSNNVDWEKYVDRVRKESGSIDSGITGKDLHRMVMRDEGYRPDMFDTENYQIGTSEALRNYGIPGIKYLDATSRDAGKGTRNFVVFPGEEDALTILERKKEGGEVRMKEGGAAFGVFPQAKGKRSKQDREAAKTFPIDVARGFVSGALGMPGDLEGLARLLMNIQGPDKFVMPRSKDEAMAMLGQLFAADRVSLDTKLPTSEDIEKRLPFKSDSPLSQAATGLGQIGGGFYTGPLSGARAVTAIPKAVGKAGKDFVMAAGQPAVNVVKPKGGNFLTDRLGRELSDLKLTTPGWGEPSKALEKLMKLTPEERSNLTPQIDELQRVVGINNWVDRNLTNYIKNQMATPEDPVRLMLDKRTAEVEAKFAKDMERADRLAERAAAELDPRMKANLTRNADEAKTTAEMERDLAMSHMLPSQQYLMGNARQVAGESRVNRAVEGFPEEGMAKSPAGKAWEDITDSDMGVSANRAGDAQSAVEKKQKTEEALVAFRAKEPEINEAFIKMLVERGLKPLEIQNLNKALSARHKLDLLENPNLSDEYERLSKAVETQNIFKDKDLYIAEQYPWVSKLDPETRLYEFYGSHDLGFDHIIDVLKQDVAAGRITPEQLNRMSVDQAVRRAADYDKELAEKMNSARAAAREGLPVYKEYPEGYRWVELNKPGSFSSESEAMGHSVRGYEPPKGHPDWVEGSGDSGSEYYGHGGWEGIKSGKAKVYSLVDPKGNPHVTVEQKAGKPWNERSGIFYDNPELEPSWRRFSTEASLEDKAKGLNRPSNYIERYPEWLKANEPEMFAKYSKVFEQESPVITQIKGKQNTRPNEKYDQYTQDFVKSGKWSDVRDLENTGLRRHKSSEGDKYLTEDEYLQEVRKELGLNPDEGMKRGGSVSISDNADAQMMEVEDKKMAGGGLLSKVAKAAKQAKEPSLPLQLPRAPAKTKEEIRPIAQRIAQQTTGEFVRPNPKKSINPAEKSLKQFQMEKELTHDIRPVEGKTLLPQEVADIEKQLGMLKIGVSGDATIADKVLHRAGPYELDLPSPQHGGPLFALGGEGAWASNNPIAATFQKRVQELSQAHGDAPTLGQFVAMGPKGSHFALHLADANLRAIDLSKMTEKQIETVNDIIRQGTPKSGPRPGFPGIEDKDSAYLHFAFDPELRKAFNMMMSKPDYTSKLGLPDGRVIQHAVTEPELRNSEILTSGLSQMRLDPSVNPADLKLSAHPTYSHVIPKVPESAVARTKYPTPAELEFPDVAEFIKHNYSPKDATRVYQTATPRQMVDPQHIDEIKMYEELMKEYTGKKAGGEVKMQAGGLLKRAAKALKGTQEVLPAAEREANLEKMLEGSAVKDRLYHGTGDDITEFRPSKIGAMGPGTYLTKKPEVASGYSDVTTRRGSANQPNVVPVYAQVKKPFNISSVNKSNEELFKHFDPIGKLSDDQVIELLRKGGYDAIHALEEGEINVLDPRKIKSAIGNRGTYNTSKPDINEAIGGLIKVKNKRKARG